MKQILSNIDRPEILKRYKEDAGREWFIDLITKVFERAPSSYRVTVNPDGTFEYDQNIPTEYLELINHYKKELERYERAMYPELFD